MHNTIKQIEQSLTGQKKFGIALGLFFSLIAVWPIFRHGNHPHLIPGFFGVVLIIFAFVYPKALTRPFQLWNSLGSFLGRINTVIILSTIFFLILTPIALFRRMFGKDLLMLRKSPDTISFRKISDESFKDDMEKQF